MTNGAARKVVHFFEVLSLIALLGLLGKTAYGKFYRGPVDVLDSSTDPRLMVVDLVAVQQLSRSSQVPHRINFELGADGTIRSYSILYASSFGEPWIVLRGHSFPSRVKVTSPQASIEFAADGTLARPCELNFDHGRRRWQLTMSEGAGEIRLLPSGEPLPEAG